MHTRIAVITLAAALALSPALTLADEGSHSLEQLVVEMADTPADHAALAGHYRAKAAAARAESAKHESMGRTYSGGKFFQRTAMQAHCKKIAEENAAVAAEYEELAKLHEAESMKQ